MRCRIRLPVTVLMTLAAVTSIGLAQCNRGGGRSPSAGANTTSFAPQFASAGFNSPLTSQFGAQQLTPQLALQRQMLMQQMQLRQAMMQRQQPQGLQQAQQQFAQRQRSVRGPRPDRQRQASTESIARRDNIRQQNAEKVFASAQRAERRGDTRKAEKYYERVVRILGPEASLSERAETAIAVLTSDGDADLLELKSALASIE